MNSPEQNKTENTFMEETSSAKTSFASIPPDVVLSDFRRNSRWVIEANAGTGKTYTLEKTVAHLIAQNIVPAEKILLVTFTVKAATELRSRVRKKLRETRKEMRQENQTVEHIDTALGLPDALWNISTIHGFCQSALLDFALFSKTAPQFKLVNEKKLALEVIERLMRTRWLKETETRLYGAICSISSHSKDLKTFTEKLAQFWTSGIRAAADWEPFPKGATALYDGQCGTPDNDLTSAVDIFFREALLQLPQEMIDIRQKNGLMTYNSLVSDLHTRLYDSTEVSGILLRALRHKYQICIVDEFQDTDRLQWEIFQKIFCDSPEHGFVCVGDPKQSIYSFRGADLKCYFDATRSLLNSGASFTHLAESWRSSEQMVAEVNTLLNFNGTNGFYHLDYRGKESRAARKNVGIWQDKEKQKPLHPIRVFETKTGKGKVRKNTALAIAQEIQRLMKDPPWICVGDDGVPRRLQLSDIMILTAGRIRVANEIVQGDQTDVAAALNLLKIPYWVYKHEKLFRLPEVQTLLDVFLAALKPDFEQLRNRALHAPLVCGHAGTSWEPEFDPERPERRPTRAAELFIKKVGELLEARRYHALLGLCRRRLVELTTLDDLHKNNILVALEELMETAIKENLNAWQTLEQLRTWILEGDDSEEQSVDSDSNTRHIQGQHSTRNAVTLVTWHSAKGAEAPVTFVTGGFFRPEPVSYNLDLQFSRNGDGHLVCCIEPLTVGGANEKKKSEPPHNLDELERVQYVALTRAAVLMYLPYAEHHKSTNIFGTWFAANYAVKNYLKTCSFAREQAIRPHPMISLYQPYPDEFRVTGNPYAEAAGKEVEVMPLREDELPASQCVFMNSYSSLKQKSALHQGKGSRSEPVFTDTESESADELSEQTDSSSEGSDDTLLAGIGGKQFGIFVHSLFEEINWLQLREGPKSRGFQDEVERVLQLNVLEIANRFGADSFTAVKEMFTQALTTPLVVSGVVDLPHGIWNADKVLCEVEFQLPEVFTGADSAERRFYKGFIDVVFEHRGKVYFLDWKTDRLESSQEANQERLREAMETRGYEMQLHLYALAVFRAVGGHLNATAAYEKFGGGVYMFLRLGEQGVYARRPALQELTVPRPLPAAALGEAARTTSSKRDIRNNATAGAT